MTTGSGQLSDDERATLELELERSWWKHPGAKDAHIREAFALSPTVYYARLNRLIDRPETMAADPLLVRRLQRLRAQRRAHRAAVRATFD